MTVTIPPFNYDAMYAQEPTVWSDRGLHWHAYAWRGTGRDWADDSARGSDSTEITPTAVRGWLRRPARQLRGAHSTPDEAAAWVVDQWTKALAEALTPIPEWTSEGRHAAALYELRCGNDLSWGVWVKGPSMVSFAVVGTTDRCH